MGKHKVQEEEGGKMGGKLDPMEIFLRMRNLEEGAILWDGFTTKHLPGLINSIGLYNRLKL